MGFCHATNRLITLGFHHCWSRCPNQTSDQSLIILSDSDAVASLRVGLWFKLLNGSSATVFPPRAVVSARL